MFHSERRGAQGDFAANLAKTDDANRAAVQTAAFRNPCPIAAPDMSAVERLVW
jgi:hypothetical protein